MNVCVVVSSHDMHIEYVNNTNYKDVHIRYLTQI